MLRTIAKRFANPLGKSVAKKRDQVVIRRLEKIFASENGETVIKNCRKISNDLRHEKDSAVTNALINFTLHLHAFRKICKQDIYFVEAHLNGLGKGPVGEFIKILKGDYQAKGQNMHIYFDTKNFESKGFYKGIIITLPEDKKVTLGELQTNFSDKKTTKQDLDLVLAIRGYMSRTVKLMELIRDKKY